MRKTNKVYLHTGSNLGARKFNIETANRLIERNIGPIIKKSGYYETKAWGITDQPDFINQALEVMTRHSPEELMESILRIEKLMGRERNGKWTSRLIDIDILFYENEIIDREDLKIPHPHLHNRNFVLIPLQEIAGAFVHPVLNLNINELVGKSKDVLAVTVH